MATYYIQFEAVPTESNEHYSLVDGALVNCWVLAGDPQSALSIANFHVAKHGWLIEKTKTLPVVTTRTNFIDKDLGLKNYDKAQEDGVSVVYIALSKDRKTTAGPIPLKPSWELNIAEYLGVFKRAQKSGRCLHYDSGKRCNKIINAHSIQKMGVLSEIAEDGHVYRLSAEIGSLKKNGGRPSFEKIGINKTSTFYGFCEKHDNKLFQPIDNDPLIPTDQQVLLYGYRSLCREIFVKENVLATIESQLEKGVGQKAVEEFFLDYQKGISFGLKNLKKHKTQYDDSIVNGDYQDINYVLFISTQKPVIAFSGGLYPDFDFMGRHLQDLGDHEKELEQISFSSAPMKSGWGFLFSWHKSSSIVCVDYMRSLATMMSNGKKLEDFLFRLVISGCENHAISPGWWDQLPDNHKEKVLERVNMDSNIHSMTQPSYLMSGLEGISDWKFGKVISKME